MSTELISSIADSTAHKNQLSVSKMLKFLPDFLNPTGVLTLIV